jgi:hypothetical protein
MMPARCRFTVEPDRGVARNTPSDFAAPPGHRMVSGPRWRASSLRTRTSGNPYLPFGHLHADRSFRDALKAII